jgi:predicted nucleic acid-binding protein
MAALRCLIDAMVFDAIAAEPDMTATVDRLTSARRLELLTAAVVIEQIAATPEVAHRKALQRVRVLVAPPPDPEDAPTSVLLAVLAAGSGVGFDDALIATTAALQQVPFVTEDRALREAVGRELPAVALWRWSADLRPRILTLAAERPVPPRYR